MRSAVCFCISAQWNLQRFRQTLISSGKLKFMNRCRLQAESSIFVDFRSISNLRVFSAKGSSTAGLIYDVSRGPLAGQTESPRSDQMRNACRYGPMQHTHTDTHTHRHSHTHTHKHKTQNTHTTHRHAHTQTLTHTHTQTQNPKHTHNTKYTHTHCHKSAIFFSQLWLFSQFLLFEFWLFSDCDLLQQTHI